MSKSWRARVSERITAATNTTVFLNTLGATTSPAKLCPHLLVLTASRTEKFTSA